MSLNVPGFDAESSLYKTNESYRVAFSHQLASESSILAALVCLPSCLDSCENACPDPGEAPPSARAACLGECRRECCVNRPLTSCDQCWQACSSDGGSVTDECAAQCRGYCGGIPT